MADRDFKLSAPHTALILQGTQNDIVHPDGAMAAPDVLEFARKIGFFGNVTRLATALRRGGGAVLHVFFVMDPEGASLTQNAPMFRTMREKKAHVRGTWGVAPHAELVPHPDDFIVEKARMNPFHNSTTDSILRGLGVTDVISAGGLTNTGVEAAARAAADLGYRVWIPYDACITHNDEWHHASLHYNATKYARVATTDELVEALG